LSPPSWGISWCFHSYAWFRPYFLPTTPKHTAYNQCEAAVKSDKARVDPRAGKTWNSRAFERVQGETKVPFRPLFVLRNKPVKGIHGVFCFGTETRKKMLFVLGVSLSVCFECSPSQKSWRHHLCCGLAASLPPTVETKLFIQWLIDTIV